MWLEGGPHLRGDTRVLALQVVGVDVVVVVVVVAADGVVGITIV